MIDRATNVRMDGFILFHLKSKKKKEKKSHMRGQPETCRETETARWPKNRVSASSGREARKNFAGRQPE